MENRYEHKIITIPNLLSFFRLLLIPVIVWMYLVRQNTFGTVVLLALSGITDVVDGLIARKGNMISALGKALDPVADKLTQIAVLFCLVRSFHWMLLPLILLTVKEAAAGIVSLIMIRRTKTVNGALWHGKAATASLYCMMLIHLLWPDMSPVFSGAMILICTALVLLSAVLYGKRYIGAFARKSTETNTGKREKP